MATKTKPESQSNGMIKIRVTLKSHGAGLLMDPMQEETIDGLQTKVHAKIDRTLSKDKIAESKVIKDSKGRIGIPISYIKACLVEAGRHVKDGKSKISTVNQTTLFSFLDFGSSRFVPLGRINPQELDEEIRDLVNSEGWMADRRRGNNNATGKPIAVAIIRPLFPVWQITLEVNLDTAPPFGVKPEVVKELFVIAGKKVGLGSYRPTRKGDFGMFNVVGWEIV